MFLVSSPLTVLMAGKNGLPYLAETLASLGAQTYRNFTVLVWDNGSTDGTQELLKTWIPGRVPGKVILDHPLPLGESRARLVELAQTPWCAVLDSNGVCLPEPLGAQVDYLERNSHVDVLGSAAFLIDEGGKMGPRLWNFPELHSQIFYDLIIGQLATYCHSCTMFRQRALLECGNYRVDSSWEGSNVEDWDIALRLAACGKIFANLKIPLVKYRVHRNSTTALSHSDGRLNRASTRCFLEQIPRLRLSAAQYVALTTGQLKLAMPTLTKLAGFIASRLGLSQPLKDGRFLARAAVRVNRRDHLTRLILRLLRGPGSHPPSSPITIGRRPLNFTRARSYH